MAIKLTHAIRTTHSTQGSEKYGSEFVSVWAVMTTLLHLAD